jgi:hypothetical protein
MEYNRDQNETKLIFIFWKKEQTLLHLLPLTTSQLHHPTIQQHQQNPTTLSP